MSFLNVRIIFHSKLISDGVIGFGADRFAKLASTYTEVYYYLTTYVSRYSYVYYPGTQPYGNAKSKFDSQNHQVDDNDF